MNDCKPILLVQLSFHFSNYFIQWKTSHQFEVKTQIIQLIAQKPFKKKLDVEEFLKPFHKLSIAKQTRVKKIFIEGIDQEIQNNCLQSKFQIIQKDNSVLYISQLKPKTIPRSKYIYFYESVNYKNLLKFIETSGKRVIS